MSPILPAFRTLYTWRSHGADTGGAVELRTQVRPCHQYSPRGVWEAWTQNSKGPEKNPRCPLSKLRPLPSPFALPGVFLDSQHCVTQHRVCKKQRKEQV